jgi:hypothetical protein
MPQKIRDEFALESARYDLRRYFNSTLEIILAE